MEEETMYPCTNCEESFASKIKLVSHSKLKHKKCVVVCELCGNGFKNNKNLKFHQNQCVFVQEASSRPLQERFMCVHCKGGAIFNHPNELKRHARKKHEDCKFSCCCGNLFESKKERDLHLRECVHYQGEN
ncbi:Oocyte zinc finger protein [Arachis hypogaea]|nr:oocyte zinc finger protein XlCOF20-like [Arachis hypogaea]QHO26398.1 Oocyte zinc finger protein [Arachis hypogaea]